MELLVVTGAGIAEKVASSPNPWIYLSIILIIAALLAGRYIFNYLINLDQAHREESKEREKKMNEQINRSIEANLSLSETQKEIVTAINTMGATVNEVKTDVTDLRLRLEKFEKRESA
ncbi:hypothetical protein [Solibacillus sp. R5-41]|uniref:hypothetical protein n=1 Tax=Solibacillus sp. R5-41 TaxID=2048654 RepID=UPI001C12C84C|nr:hypothetical protein [Solibacillus sp. R5-41]